MMGMYTALCCTKSHPEKMSMCDKCQMQHCTDCIDTHTCDHVKISNCVILCTQQVAHSDFVLSGQLNRKKDMYC